MRNQYSIAICPPAEVVKQVKNLKEELKEDINRKFGSYNSEAHITVNVFVADENELNLWEKYLRHFCNTIAPFRICLTSTDAFESGAFYLAPDEESHAFLKNLLIRFNKTSPLAPKATSSEPHLSIARQLSPHELKKADTLFSGRNFSIYFTCDNLAIRKFNTQLKQYEVYKRFPLGTGLLF